MNKYIIAGLAFVGGGVAGFFIGKKTAMKKVQQLADEQVEDVKKSLTELYEDRIREAREKAELAEQKDEDQTAMTDEEMGVDPGVNDDARDRFPGTSATVQSDGTGVKPKPQKKTAAPKVISRKKAEVMKRPTDLPPDAVDTPDGYPDPDDENAPPYLIREKDYGELDNFDTIELILWADRKVSANDSYCELVSPTKLFEILPENWVNMFDWDKTGKYTSVIYFRNNKEKVDIEIVKDVRTYREYLEAVYPGRVSEADD